jgi:ketosteroid isomerase-like protein
MGSRKGTDMGGEMISVLGGAILMAAASSHPAGTFVDMWHEALRTGAKDAVLAALAPDVSIFESGEAEMSRAEYSEHHLVADMEFAASTATTVHSRSFVDIAAGVAVLSRTSTSGTFRGQQIAVHGVETMLLQRSGDTWRIRHIHWSSGRDEGATTAGDLTARSLAAKLRAEKLVVKERPPIKQPFFKPKAQVLVIGDEDVQVFEFTSAREAEQAAATVDATGSTIGTTAMHWMAAPHFYRSGRIVAIHLGTSPGLRGALEKIMGKPFAGS